MRQVVKSKLRKGLTFHAENHNFPPMRTPSIYARDAVPVLKSRGFEAKQPNTYSPYVWVYIPTDDDEKMRDFDSLMPSLLENIKLTLKSVADFGDGILQFRVYFDTSVQGRMNRLHLGLDRPKNNGEKND